MSLSLDNDNSLPVAPTYLWLWRNLVFIISNILHSPGVAFVDNILFSLFPGVLSTH